MRFMCPGLVITLAVTSPMGGSTIMKSRTNSSEVCEMRRLFAYAPPISSFLISTLISFFPLDMYISFRCPHRYAEPFVLHS